MTRCQQCGSKVEQAVPFCSQCGSPLGKRSTASSGADAPTVGEVTAADAPTYSTPRTTSTSRLASHPSRDEGRFPSGILIADRYRIISLLGRGGMGEVYRADDLTLDQPVALKFLPAGVASNDARLAQFHNELRVARQVSHKNVCRLYDLGDASGHRFLTMEY